MSQEGEISNLLYRNDNDEIGDLARSFSTLLARLDQHNQYLKTLSGKLSHELRTPLTIIKSSLENMTYPALSEESRQQEKKLTPIFDENQKYALRAKEGCKRLSDLLNRMSEASRLEHSINTTEKETIEIVNFLRNYIDAIQLSNSTTRINFITSLLSQDIHLSPELIAQLLDKLFSNAISYHKNGTDITFELHKKNNQIIIKLTNYGQLIDENKLESIFNSLTSYRQKKGRQVHLGLGLYIARLISHFHHGHLEAKNNLQEQSVSFILSLPLTI